MGSGSHTDTDKGSKKSSPCWLTNSLRTGKRMDQRHHRGPNAAGETQTASCGGFYTVTSTNHTSTRRDTQQTLHTYTISHHCHRFNLVVRDQITSSPCDRTVLATRRQTMFTLAVLSIDFRYQFINRGLSIDLTSILSELCRIERSPTINMFLLSTV